MVINNLRKKILWRALDDVYVSGIALMGGLFGVTGLGMYVTTYNPWALFVGVMSGLTGVTALLPVSI
jgi:hypothetical protein